MRIVIPLGYVMQVEHHVRDLYMCEIEMDAKAVEVLSKGLQACKRKGTASDEPDAKKARVNTPSTVALADAAVAIEEDLQAEVNHLQKKTAEFDRLLKEKVVKVEGLQEALRKGKLTSMGLKATLALEEERRKKTEVKVSELKNQTSKQISKAKIQAVEEFKIFSKMRDLNIAFG
ncbi:hypothetical protein COCNU_06G018400 [Cocos nucifera]|uniref:Uncharacterized protein n=1 Tax=Cocos nucifera TaxID=13894 RepID=A0A8K0ID07_COCNU|nr:hypothetical protein COCNU_06G018400 [Cocos nucifera]